MGQQEVYILLKQNKGKWFSSKEVAEKLKISVGSVTVSLHKLRKTNLIYFELARTVKSGNKGYLYKFRK